MPCLEQTNLASAGIKPVSKRLVLDSAKLSQLPTKIKGVSLVDGALYLINDDDFGIEGQHTTISAIESLTRGQ